MSGVALADAGQPPGPGDDRPTGPVEDRPHGSAEDRTAGSGRGSEVSPWALGPYVPQRFPPRVHELAARLDRALARVQGTTAGRVQRRVKEMNLVNQAMVLAAMAMMLLIPALITLAAIVPLGDSHGLAQVVTRRLGLSAQASHDVQQLFGGPGVKRTSSSWLGAAVTLVSAYSWPAALQKGYEIAWQLPGRGRRDLWRPLVWLGALLGAVVLIALLAADQPGGLVRSWLLPLAAAPVVFLWAWWTQHLLLGGRVGWRPLVAGAVTITLGLFGLRAFAALSLSESIVYNSDRYGPIGIVFMLLSWFIALSVVMLGGAVVGQELWSVRQRRQAARRAASAGQAG